MLLPQLFREEWTKFCYMHFSNSIAFSSNWRRIVLRSGFSELVNSVADLFSFIKGARTDLASPLGESEGCLGHALNWGISIWVMF